MLSESERNKRFLNFNSNKKNILLLLTHDQYVGTMCYYSLLLGHTVKPSGCGSVELSISDPCKQKKLFFCGPATKPPPSSSLVTGFFRFKKVLFFSVVKKELSCGFPRNLVAIRIRSDQFLSF